MVDLMKQNKLVEAMNKLVNEVKVNNINNKLYNSSHNFQQEYLHLNLLLPLIVFQAEEFEL
jgi:hypothetical protein